MHRPSLERRAFFVQVGMRVVGRLYALLGVAEDALGDVGLDLESG